MEEFSAVVFYHIGRYLVYLQRQGQVAAEESNPNNILTEEQLRKPLEVLEAIRTHCKEIGLGLSVKTIARIVEQAEGGTLSHKALQDGAEDLARRISDEIEDKLFMFVPSERAALYNQAELFGKEVNAKFPAIQFDVVETGNCYTAGRGTAVVFHLMRIMEVGVQKFGKALGVSLANEKNWQNILDQADKAIKALNAKDPKTVAMCQASASLYAVKLAWRNEVMHPKDTYTLEEADNLIRQVKIFMEQLAQIV